ncbi:MAG TPA: FAD:protein FMN transferase [Acidimicrobiales bacterium]|nr:FAD:protein FMN transferase [Acidimicrobiales bacterium]
MASHIEIQAPVAAVGNQAALRALEVFHEVNRSCTRFDPSSPLMRCNSRPDRWHRVPPSLLKALQAALEAHLETARSFDPRVHDALVSLGYDRSFALGTNDEGEPAAAPRTGRWTPRFLPRLSMVHLGGERVDLGGIGKGLALRWAREVLLDEASDFLIAAGGDVVAAGGPSPDSAWRIAVEDPAGEEEPVAVLKARDCAVATSSVRVRSWKHLGEPVHHLIDPRTGRPGGEGLLSVTVLHPDPAWAEIWAKSLFLAGPEYLSATASRHGITALWVNCRGELKVNVLMRPFVVWTSR